MQTMICETELKSSYINMEYQTAWPDSQAELKKKKKVYRLEYDNYMKW